jgi:hypothetical protein
MPSSTKDEFLTLRLPRKLYEQVKELAVRNERTLAGEVRLALRKHVENGSQEPEERAA